MASIHHIILAKWEKMALKLIVVCALAFIQTISGQTLNGLRPGFNGNGLAANILAGNSMLANAGFGLGLNGANGLALGNGVAANGLGLSGNALGLSGPCTGSASTGGSLAVSSASPVSPVGVSVKSENVYEGGLVAGGNLPLLGTVALEGALPSAGAGAVSYGCGDGSIGITAESGSIVTGIASPGSYGPGLSAVGPAGPGVGYNGLGRIGYGPGCAL